MDLRQVFANTLSKLMKENDKICILDADLSKPNGTAPLHKEFPNRCFNVGISEANMAGIAAGLSSYGYKPIILTFTPFATRRICDQVAVSIAYAKQNVIIVGTDPGITAELNGGTHMSFEDIGVMRSIPTMQIYDVVDEVQFEQAIPQLLELNGPVYVRVPRKTRPVVFDKDYKFVLGKSDVLVEGKDISILASGTMVHEAILASEILKQDGINAEVISVNMVKPLDKETILKSVMKTQNAIVCENHNIYGGVYSAIAELICQEYPVKCTAVGVKDTFGQVGKYDELLKAYEMTKEDIVKKVREQLNK